MLKLLIADDEAITRDGLKNSVDWMSLDLELVGCAEHGAAALEIFQSNPSDIVLTDVKMPYMDGLELAKRIKELDSSVMIILLTAYDDFKYAQQAIKLGVFDYILKPIDIDLLIETVSKAVKLKKDELAKPAISYLDQNDLKLYHSEKYKEILKIQEELVKAVKRSDLSASLSIVDKAWNEFMKNSYSVNVIKRWIIETIPLFTPISIKLEIDPLMALSRLKSVEELYNWSCSAVSFIIDLSSQGKKHKNRRLIDEIYSIIDKEYKNKDLSLNLIGEKLCITPNYLSVLFKENIGENFSDFLAKYRIEKAKELLVDVKLKIYEISYAVGYTDSQYFSKVFKSITGLTPKEYRERST